MKISQAIENYIDHLNYLNYSPRTIELYHYCLSRFINYFQDISVNEILPSQLYDYQRYLFRQKISPPTQSSHLTSVRMLFRFLIRKQLIDNDPTTCIELPKIDKHLPKNILTINQIKLMIEATDQFGELSLRNRAILELFYATGMRVSELRNLTLNSINPNDHTIRIIGKGRKERIIPISTRAIAITNQYIDKLRPRLLKLTRNYNLNCNRLILSYRGNSLNNDNVAIIVRAIAKAANIPVKITPHTLRHSLATHLLQAGMGIRYIQEILGHHDLRTTQIYTQVQNNDLIEMVEKYHPLR